MIDLIKDNWHWTDIDNFLKQDFTKFIDAQIVKYNNVDTISYSAYNEGFHNSDTEHTKYDICMNGSLTELRKYKTLYDVAKDVLKINGLESVYITITFSEDESHFTEEYIFDMYCKLILYNKFEIINGVKTLKDNYSNKYEVLKFEKYAKDWTLKIDVSDTAFIIEKEFIDGFESIFIKRLNNLRKDKMCKIKTLYYIKNDNLSKGTNGIAHALRYSNGQYKYEITKDEFNKHPLMIKRKLKLLNV